MDAPAVPAGADAGAGPAVVSCRDVREVASRILTTAGVDAASARRAAVIVEHLEVQRSCGLTVLASGLAAGGGRWCLPELRPRARGRLTSLDTVGISALVAGPPALDVAYLGPGAAWLPGVVDGVALEEVAMAATRHGVSTVACWRAGNDVEAVAAAGDELKLWRLPGAGGLLLACAARGDDALVDAIVAVTALRANDATRALPPAGAVLSCVDADAATLEQHLGPPLPAYALEQARDRAHTHGLAVPRGTWDRLYTASRRALVDDA